MHLAIAAGPLIATAALLALVLLVAPFVWLGRSRLASAFAVYLCATIGVTELGNFPVPVLGAGASPVLGWYLLLALSTSEPAPST